LLSLAALVVAAAQDGCFTVDKPPCAHGVQKLILYTEKNGPLTWTADGDLGSFTFPSSASTHFVLSAALCDATIRLTLTHADGSCFQDVSVNDADAPLLFGLPSEQTLSATCDDIPAPYMATARDACQGSTSVLFSESKEATALASQYKLIRTWTTSDSCPNEESHSQTITVSDNTGPTLIGLPEDETVSCDFVPEPCEVVAEDNCAADAQVSYNENRNDGSCPDTYTLHRDWTASDGAGNPTSKAVVVEVVDAEKPNLLGFSASDLALVVECDAIPSELHVTAVDNCDTAPTVGNWVPAETNPVCTHSYTLTRTLEAVDRCLNKASVEQVLTVRDSTPPVLTGVDGDVFVSSEDAVPDKCTPSCVDNCAGVLEPVYSEIKTPSACKHTYNLTRTWECEDECGNSAGIGTQLIVVVDNDPPKFSTTPPHSLTVECNRIPTYTITAVDDNSGTVAVSYAESVMNQASCCQYTLVREWTAQDDCGLTATLTQTVTVSDGAAPEFAGLPSASIQADCNSHHIDSPHPIVATDNCEGDDGCSTTEISLLESRENGLCDDNFTIIRVWTAADCSGNSATFTQQIRVSDTTPPRLSQFPASTTLAAGEASTFDWPSVQATDNCGAVGTEFSDSSSPNACGLLTITRTWSATDACGNEAVVHSMTIEEVDTEKPTIIPPSPDNCECGSCVPVGNASVSDNVVGAALVGPSVSVDDTDPCAHVITHTWSATDCSNNPATASVSHTVTDVTPPTLSFNPSLADFSVEMGEGVSDPQTGSADDDCSDVTIEYSEKKEGDDQACDYTLTRTWQGVQQCGSSNVAQQVVTVSDTTSCSWTTPVASLAFECKAQMLASTSEPTGLEAGCDMDDGNVITLSEHACGGDYKRTWTSSDPCDNTDTFTQTLTVEDKTAPTFVEALPQDFTVSCSEAIPPQGRMTATDNCGGNVIVTPSSQSFPKNCDGDNFVLEIVRTWTAKDTCELETVTSQTIRVYDLAAPTFSEPSDNATECAGASATPPTASDACQQKYSAYLAAPTVHVSSTEQQTCGGLTNTNYIWSATDACGNSAATKASKTEEKDDNKPTFDNLPTGQTFNCTIPEPPVVTGSDQCGGAVVVTSSEIGDRSSHVDITYHAIDQCDNAHTANVTFKAVDNEAPTANRGDNTQTVVCNAAVPTWPAPTWADNCDTHTESSSVEETDACFGKSSITHTYSASDSRGQSTTVTDSVTITNPFTAVWDGELPDASLTDSYTNQNLYQVKLDNSLLKAHHPCFEIPVTCSVPSFTPSATCEHEGTITRSCTAQHACNVLLTFVQTISLVDDQDPSFLTLPEDTTMTCAEHKTTYLGNGMSYTPPVVTLHESEDTLTNTSTGVTLSTHCFNKTWFFTGEDCAQNTAEANFTFTVEDNHPPVFAGCPSDTIEQCEATSNRPSLVADDVCDGTIPIVNGGDDDSQLTASGTGNRVRTWSAVDGCTNEGKCTQTITIQDNIAPSIVGLADVDVTIASIALNRLNNDIASPTDLCDPNPQLSLQQEQSYVCEHTFTVIRTWTVVDEAGNENSTSQTISASDTTPPVLSGVNGLPVDRTMEWYEVQKPGGAYPIATLLATDENHQNTWDVNPTQFDGANEKTIDFEDSHIYKLVRVWETSDECGNNVNYTQTITVQDTTPVICGVSNRTIECASGDALLTAEQVTQLIKDSRKGVQNCPEDWDTNSVLTYSEITTGTPDFCYTTTRTWVAENGGAPGSSVSVEQVLVMQDTTPPEWDLSFSRLPDVLQFQCMPGQIAAGASDTCGSEIITVTHDDSIPANYNLPYTFTRTFFASDKCLNNRTRPITVDVLDSYAPQADPATVPAASVQATCEAPEKPNDPTFTDNCGTLSVTYTTASSMSCANRGTVEHIWKATDTTGNVTTIVQTVHVTDNVAPTWSSVLPQSYTLECGATITPPSPPTAGDNCATSATVTPNPVQYPAATAPVKKIEVHSWTAADSCGNNITHAMTIRVIDTTPPTIDAPADVTENCRARDWTNPTSLDTSDTCGNPTVDLSETESTTGCTDTSSWSKTLVRHWTITDYAGLTASDSQTLYMEDTAAPTFTPASLDDESGECGTKSTSPAPQALDACGTVQPITPIESETGNACETVITTAFTASDGCLSNTITRKYTAKDTVKPYFTYVPPASTEYCSHASAPQKLAEANDDCTGPASVSYSDKKTSIVCDYKYKIERTWQAEDGCGFQSNPEVQTITVVESQSTQFDTPPASQTLECKDTWTPPKLNVTDGCGKKEEISHTASSWSGSDTVGTQIVTYTYTDACGETIGESITVVVTDSTPPEVTGTAEDKTIECGDAIPDPPSFTATDACGTLSETFSQSDSPPTCGGSYDVVRTWVFTDEQGLFTTKTQTITIVDSNAPVIPPMADETHDCSAPAYVPFTVEDCSGNVTVELASQSDVGDCPHNFVRTRLFSAQDDCQHENTRLQKLTVVDVTGPALSNVPTSKTLECGATAGFLRAVQGSDTCSGPTVVRQSVLWDNSDSCLTTMTRSFHTEDACGNPTTASATFTYEDTQGPVFTAPVDATAHCHCVPDPVAPADASDCQGATKVTMQPEVRNNVSDSVYNLVRTWVSTDACNNPTSHPQTITVHDVYGPALTCPPPETHECSAPPAIPVTPLDLCDLTLGPVTPTESDTAKSCANNYTTTREYAVTDAAGNPGSCTQVVTIRDTEAPTITFSQTPQSATVQCSAPDLPTTSASDTCSGALTVEFSELAVANGQATDITRTWTATDSCGHSDEKTVQIRVHDTQPPTISGGSHSSTKQCNESPVWQPVTASDNCGGVSVTHVETTIPGTCSGEKKMSRTYTATDSSGLTAIFQTTIIFEDNQGPSLSGVPGDLTVDSLCEVPQVDLSTVSATDLCSTALPVTVTEAKTGTGCTTGYTIVRTFTAKDDCGNENKEYQTITVTDTIAPVLQIQPADETVECDVIPDACENSAVDECGGVLYPVKVADVIVGNVITRTWSAEDCAGNEAEHIQSITVLDTTKPQFTRSLSDETVDCDCDSQPAPPVLLALDNCDATVDVQFTEDRTEIVEGSTYMLDRTWTACDEANNCNTLEQRVTLVDDSAPQTWGVPENLDSLECSDDLVDDARHPAAADNCDQDMSMSYAHATTTGSCDQAKTIVRSWSFSDATGNVKNEAQTLSIVDTTAPDFVDPIHITCIYPAAAEASDQYAAFNLGQVMPIADNCDSNFKLTLVKCNSTQPRAATATNDYLFDEDCFVDETAQLLVVKAARLEGSFHSAADLGREYWLHAEAEDGCGNSRSVKKGFWVPQTRAGATNCMEPNHASTSAGPSDHSKTYRIHG